MALKEILFICLFLHICNVCVYVQTLILKPCLYFEATSIIFNRKWMYFISFVIFALLVRAVN